MSASVAGVEHERLRLACACVLGLVFCVASGVRADAALPEARVQKARACFAQAQAAYERGALQEARDGFRCAYEIMPSPELAWNLARVHERMGEVADSIRFYRLVLAAGVKDERERKDIERRIAELEALAERQRASIRAELGSQAQLGDEARVFFRRGVKLYQRKRYEAAMVAFTAALRASDAPELRYNLAVTAERLERWQDALDHYRAYLAVAPNAEDEAAISARVDELRAKLR